MSELCRLIFGMVIDLLRSRAALEVEIVLLRQQINVLRRTNPKRLPFVSIDRLILGGVCRLFPEMFDALAIVRPETVIRWHRAGFRSYWHWKSRHRCQASRILKGVLSRLANQIVIYSSHGGYAATGAIQVSLGARR